MKIQIWDFQYPSEQYRKIIQNQLPQKILDVGISESFDWFMVNREQDEYWNCNLVGPNSYGHWARIEIRSKVIGSSSEGELIDPDNEHVSESAQLFLMLEDEKLFLEQYGVL